MIFNESSKKMGFEDRTVICEKKELKRLIIFLRKVLVRIDFFIYICTMNELQVVEKRKKITVKGFKRLPIFPNQLDVSYFDVTEVSFLMSILFHRYYILEYLLQCGHFA